MEIGRKFMNREIMRLTIPILIETVLASLFGMVDLLMVGQAGRGQKIAASIAAIGMTTQYAFLAQMVIQAFSSGGTAIISRYFGSKKYDKIENVFRHVLVIAMIFFVFPYVLSGLLFAEKILMFFGAGSDTISVGSTYFRIVVIGMMFQSYNICITAAFRGIGNSSLPMKVNLFSNFFNIIANFLLIYGMFGFPRLEITGAAIATALAQFIGSVILTYDIFHGKSYININLKNKFKFNKDIVYNMLKIGGPAALEQFLFRVAMLIYVRIVAGLGTLIFAIHQVCASIMNLTYTPGTSFGLATQTFTGRSLGEGDFELAERYVRSSSKLAVYISGTIAITFFFFSKQVVFLVNHDIKIIEKAAPVIQLMAFVQPIQCIQLVTTGGLRGSGDTMWSMITIIVSVIGIRLTLAYSFINYFNLGLMGAWYAFFSDQVFRWLLIEYRFKSGKWKYIRIR